MPLATAPDCLLAAGRQQEHIAHEIEMWKGSDNIYIVSYRHKTITLRTPGSQTTGSIWAYRSKEEPPEGSLQALCIRSFLIGRTLFDADVEDLLRPHKLAEALTT